MLKTFEDKTFTYTFDNKNNNNNKNNNFSIPQSKDITPAVLDTKYGDNSKDNPLLNNLNLMGQNNNMRNSAINNTKSTLDISITAPKQYNTNYSLINPYNSGLMINVNGNQ
jgi:hypothetical protein